MRKRNAINGIQKQKGDSCQSISTKTLVEQEYFDKYGVRVDLDYYSFYQKIRREDVEGWQKMQNTLDYMKNVGMKDEISGKMIKIKSWKKVFWHKSIIKNFWTKDPFVLINGGKPLLLVLLWRLNSFEETCKKGEYNNYLRAFTHAVAGLCGDTRYNNAIWFANSHSTKSKNSDEGYYMIRSNRERHPMPTILEAYSIEV